MIGEPDAGNPHVRFDEGRQETYVRVARLSPTLQSPHEKVLLLPRLHLPLFHSGTIGDTVKGIRMRLTVLWRRLPSIIVASLAVAGCAIEAASPEPTLVEVWRGGDDGLTLRLTDALESAFRSSPKFTLSNGRKPGTLVVTLPTHVEWRQVGTRTQVSYSVDFAAIDGRNIGASKGSCWDDALVKCASHIVGDAEIAAHKIH